MNNSILGDNAEDYAENFLQQQGLQIIQRNFSCKVGEIDIICWDQQALVFVEVRYRYNAYFGGAAASINYTKKRKLINAAKLYLKLHSKYVKFESRFDVVAIEYYNNQLICDWIKNAFYAS